MSIAPGATLQFDLSSGWFDPAGNASYTISGSGTLLKTGPGVLDQTNGWPVGTNGGAAVTISMAAGGLIDIEGGAIANKWVGVSWAGNQASVYIASGAVLDIGGNGGLGGVVIDALSGSGTVGDYFPAANTLTLGVANGSGTFSGAIMGDGDNVGGGPGTGDLNTGVVSVTKTGTGIEVLAGNNTYTGATTVSNGTLSITGALANSPVTVNGGLMSVAGTLGSLSVTVNGGTLQIGDGAMHNGAVASSSINDNSVLVFANPSAQTYAGAISGSGSVVVNAGSGALTLTGNVTCNGPTTISSGTLTAENTLLFGAGGGASIARGATLQFDLSSGWFDPAGNASYTISGSGTLLKTGPGVLDQTNGWPIGTNGGAAVTIAMGAGGPDRHRRRRHRE